MIKRLVFCEPGISATKVSKANRDEFREPMVTCIEKLADDLQAKRNLELM